jgi:hypothetical protein
MNKILVDSSPLNCLFNFSQNTQLDFLAWVHAGALTIEPITLVILI